jgi:hypothetical protein
MRFLLTIIASVIVSFIYGQTINESEITVKRERAFVGEALYGFMNGGSELYLEYGFEILNAYDVSYKGSLYSIEVYKMSSAESAFGIYSQHTFKCRPADEFIMPDCSSPGQYQSVSGNLYISVVSEERSAESAENSRVLANHYIDIFKPSATLNIPNGILNSLLPKERVSDAVKYAVGPIALSSSLSGYMGVFNTIENYSVWMVERDGAVCYAEIIFKSRSDLDSVKSGFESLFSGKIGASVTKVSSEDSGQLSLIIRFPAES